MPCSYGSCPLMSRITVTHHSSMTIAVCVNGCYFVSSLSFVASLCLLLFTSKKALTYQWLENNRLSRKQKPLLPGSGWREEKTNDHQPTNSPYKIAHITQQHPLLFFFVCRAQCVPSSPPIRAHAVPFPHPLPFRRIEKKNSRAVNATRSLSGQRVSIHALRGREGAKHLSL